MCLPQIPLSFIDHYVSEYNKGNIIETVEVLYDEEYIGSRGEYGEEQLTHENYLYALKLNSSNEIYIKPVKISWNREEIIKLFEKLSYEIGQRICDNRELEYPTPIVPHEWIEKEI